MARTRRCPKCYREKSVEEFGTNASRPDGMAQYCKQCFQQISRESYRWRQAAQGKVVREPREPAPPGTKWCNDCQEFLAVDEFPRDTARADGWMTYSKRHHNRRAVESREKVHGSARHYHLVCRYGIGAAEVEAMIARQGGVCLICMRPLGRTPHVGHDHQTGLVRGVLCFNCNGGLGQFRDDKEQLLRAVRYVDGGLAS